MNILLVDDNEKLNKTIKTFLELKNHNVISAITGQDAIDLINNNHFDLYIIDIHLPNINGIDIVKHIRSKDLNIPIIMVTASREIENLVKAFKTGCNEYIKKPFHLEELEIRINNLLNRQITDIIKINNEVSFDILNQELFINNDIVKLRKKEKRLLTILLKNAPSAVSNKDLINYIWENNSKENYPLRQLVSGLKNRVPELKDHIQAVTGIGYRFEIKK